MDAKTKLVGKLTSAKRNKLSKSTFGIPGERKYPMPDREHASLAKSYAKKELGKGNLSQGQYQTIVAKANKKLGGANA